MNDTKRPMKRSAFFISADAGTEPVSVRVTACLKTAPPILDDRQRAVRRQQLQTAFCNAGPALGANFYGSFPRQLADALGIVPTDSDDIIKNKIISGADNLDSRQTAALLEVIVSLIQRGAGNAQPALARTKELFPQLLALASPNQ
jgi:hypothetical protein